MPLNDYNLNAVCIFMQLASIMRTFLLTILAIFFIANSNGQVSFSNIESKVKAIKNNDSTQIICSNPTMSINFKLKRNVTVMQQNNFVTIDSQTIQIIPLKFSGFKKASNNLSMDDQKLLLNTYSNYELDYFRNELNIEVVNPNHQWVVTKSKGWFIWYFRIGNVPTQVSKPTEIQLFASTVIGDKVFTVNAPISSDADFNKAGLIVNDMMETLIIVRK